MAGTQNSNRPQLLEDLDVMITSRALKPGKVKLGGRFWTIKRDFTAAQVLEFWALIDQGKAIDAFAMMIGAKDAPALADIVNSAPTELLTQPLRQLYRLAGLLKRVDPAPSDDEPDSDAGGAPASAEDAGEGESPAS